MKERMVKYTDWMIIGWWDEEGNEHRKRVKTHGEKLVLVPENAADRAQLKRMREQARRRYAEKPARAKRSRKAA